MQYKATDGVLKYNIKTRNELLERHGGKYFMLDGQFEHPIGVAYDMTTRGVKHLTKEMPLQKFTMEDYSDYSDKIKWQYFNGIENLEIFETSGFTGEDFVRWHGGPYVEYITLDVGKEGRLNKDLGADTVIYHEGYDDTVTSDKQILGRSIYQSLVDLYSNETPYISVGRTPDDKEASLLGGVFDGFDEYGKVRDLVSYKSRLGNRVYNVYGESDVPTSIGYATTIDGFETNGRNRDTSKGFSWGNYQPNEFGAYTHSMNGVNNLLKKTDDLYNSHKIRTLFGRFHTSNDDDYNTYFESFDSAKVPNIGNPRGRGLLKLGVTSGNRTFQTNGYDNPYCRAWTYHHQYSRVKDLIRPLPSTSEGGRTIYEANVKYRSRIHNLDQGGKYLHQHTVLQDTGFVRITPSVSDVGDRNGSEAYTYGGDYKYNNPKAFTKLKKYMFSIENLAWGDGTSNNTRNLSIEQLGPNNGRIMWFPPYNIDFRENVSVKWNPHEFIGRGENIYTYSNTTRKGTLSFTLLIDHPALLNSMASGKYDGEGPDKDPEGDILRFFAGCQTPDPDADVDENVPPDFRNVEKEEQTVGQPETVVEPTNEPVTPPVESEEVPKDPEKIVFYVFFPNNYSGMWNNGQNLSDGAGEFNQNAPIDTDDNKFDGRGGICWYKYLLSGRNAGASGNTEGNGYEMSKDGNWKGLSIQNEKVDVIKSFIAKQNADYKVDTKKDKETENSDLWYRYRVDYDLRQSGLKHEKDNSSYYDSASFGLNSDLNVVHEAGKKDATCTFADVFSALFGLNYSSTKECENLKEVFKEDSGNVFNSITSTGGATKNDPTNANTLAMRRGHTVINTITKELNSRFPCNLQGTCSTEQVGGESYDTINSLVAKAERYARIEISYNAATKTDNATTTAAVGDLKDNKSVSEDVWNYSKYSALYGETFGEAQPPFAETRKDLVNTVSGYGMSEADKATLKKSALESMNMGASKLLAKSYDTSVVARKVTSVDELSAANTTIRRYDDEYRFFRRLEQDSPIAFRKVVDKVKYFNPAFHSLSPEGFNARLTFLHQCTRQGHTISASESTKLGIAATAGNLAFGKMPVCVLRLGDFINTKMIIESMSIDFKNGDGVQWDLNQEGAGVQPMFANVSLNIVLLGGQSLDGPINRLQNAVTFNYYANAPVYDDRADRITNNYDGTITYNHLFTPFVEGEF